MKLLSVMVGVNSLRIYFNCEYTFSKLTLLFFLGKLYFKTGRFNCPQMIVNGNIYSVNKKRLDSTVWRCISYNKSGCKCTAVTCAGSLIINKEHNHEPNVSGENTDHLQFQIVQIKYNNVARVKYSSLFKSRLK